MPSSAGGIAGWIICTTPSAGEMTRPGRFGVMRAGSRKKKAHQQVRMTPIQPSGSQIHKNRTAVTTANRATKRQPSRWIGGTVKVDKNGTSLSRMADLEALRHGAPLVHLFATYLAIGAAQVNDTSHREALVFVNHPPLSIAAGPDHLSWR